MKKRLLTLMVAMFSVLVAGIVTSKPDPYLDKDNKMAVSDPDMSYRKEKHAINAIVNYEPPDKVDSFLKARQNQPHLGQALQTKFENKPIPNNTAPFSSYRGQSESSDDRRAEPIPARDSPRNSHHHNNKPHKPSFDRFLKLSQASSPGSGKRSFSRMIGSRGSRGVVFLNKPSSVEVEPVQELSWHFSEENELAVELLFNEERREQLGPWPVNTALTALRYVAYEHPLVVTISGGDIFNPTIARSEALACRLYLADIFAFDVSLGAGFFGGLTQPSMKKRKESLETFLFDINQLHTLVKNYRTLSEGMTPDDFSPEPEKLDRYAGNILRKLLLPGGGIYQDFLETTYPKLTTTLSSCYSGGKLDDSNTSIPIQQPVSQPFLGECLWEKAVLKREGFDYLNSSWTPLEFDTMSVLVEKDYTLDNSLDALQQPPAVEIIIRLVNAEDSPEGKAYMLYHTQAEQAELLDKMRQNYQIKKVDDLVSDVNTFVLATRFFSAALDGHFGKDILPALTELAARLVVHGKDIETMPEDALEKRSIPEDWIQKKEVGFLSVKRTFTCPSL